MGEKTLKTELTPLEVANAKIIELSRDNGKLTAAIVSPYGDMEFSTPDDPQIYPAKFGGGKSTTAASVTVPIMLLGWKVTARIYARLEEKTDGTTVTFDPAVPKGIGKLDGPEGIQRFKSAVLLAAERWPGWAKAESSAIELLTGTAPEKPKAQQVKLVKRVTMAVKPDATKAGETAAA